MALRGAFGVAPNEVVAPPADVSAYEEWRKADTLRAPYKVSSALLKNIRTDGIEPHIECPLLCFVNARSGGRQGTELALRLSHAIGRVQVFDIGEKEQRPDWVLCRFYENLRALEAAGDPRATAVRRRLRLLVCGGDGTIAWVMGVIKKLKLQPEPPIAIMPLGTGNDLSRSFLWGPVFNVKAIRGHVAMYNTLNEIATAAEDRLDCWNITITTPRKAMFNNGVPHCLAPPQQPALPGLPNTGGGLVGTMTPHGRLSSLLQASGVAGYGRGQSSSLNAGGGGGPLHGAVRDTSAAGGPPAAAAGGDRSVPISVAATFGSATPLHNIATSSVGSAATTFTTATNMSLHTAAAQAGTSVPPTIVSGAISTSAEEESGIGVLGGMFWNYFSVGLDAKSAWGFHSLRESRPGCTNSRAANQFWYSFYSCTSGWFCCAQPLNIKVSLEVLRPGPGGDAAGWQPVKLPPNVKALVVLNLQSYAGGRNLWGPVTTARDEKKHGFKQPTYNDGLLEVVGLQSGWHTGLVMASKGVLLHARRICQAAGVRLALHAPYVRADGEPSHCYMQVDGEPWKQDIPVKGQESPVRVEIVHAGVSRVLRNDPAVRQEMLSARSKTDPGSAAAGPMVNVVPEPASPTTLVAVPSGCNISHSHSQSSAQLPLTQASVPLPTSAMASAHGGAAAAAAAGSNASVGVISLPQQPPSGSGALLQQGGTHALGLGSGVGIGHSGWSRIGSAGRRPSAASVVGSLSTGGVERLMSADAGGARGGGPVGRQGDVIEGGSTMGGGAQSPVNESPTTRTRSTDLGSQGGCSLTPQD